MNHNYLLVDYENVSSIDVSVLQDDMKILLFLGENSKLKADYLNKIIKKYTRVELIKINGSGRNAVDFHIAYFIGAISEKEPAASFVILSGDTGYDPLIRYLESRNIKCKRVVGTGTDTKPKPPAREKKDFDIDKLIERIKSHLSNGGEKLRPKKAGGFRAFVKSQGAPDLKAVKAIVDKMSALGLIAIQGDGIRYNF